jgi:hypothetical protein
VRAGNDAKIYFVENKKKRWIPGESIKAKFQLNGNVQSLPLATVNSFADGPAFVDPASTPGPAPVNPGPMPVPVDPLPTRVPGSGTNTLNTPLGRIA